MLLFWLTLAVTGAVVLVLAGYLIAIAVALVGAKRNVARIADALEEVAERTDPLEGGVEAIAGALKTMEVGFASVDASMDDAARTFGL